MEIMLIVRQTYKIEKKKQSEVEISKEFGKLVGSLLKEKMGKINAL